jgi:hypothetical protein
MPYQRKTAVSVAVKGPTGRQVSVPVSGRLEVTALLSYKFIERLHDTAGLAARRKRLRKTVMTLDLTFFRMGFGGPAKGAA